MASKQFAQSESQSRDSLHVREFFFSSRRRHTRYIGDWSSDVCSSDLTSISPCRSPRQRPATCRHAAALSRSEERRVGKECRERRSPPAEKEGGDRGGVPGGDVRCGALPGTAIGLTTRSHRARDM